MDDQSLKQQALYYHEFPTPGKISVTPSKQLVNQRDLALAYSPGVAAPCLEIERDPSTAALYTARGNLVAVVSNGTAVLGLGNIGPLASKPVMEGKGVLFKKFAGVDVFDIEIAENDPDKIVDIVAALEPTFGGINLEDIKAPECFYIEQKLRERMNIPVFHDDQHGTSIIVGSALLNALQLNGKNIAEIKIVASGAGAAALSCLDLLCALGVKKENIIVADSRGLITTKREDLDESKKRYMQDIEGTQIADVIGGADMFLGLSAAGILTKAMVKEMAENPIIFALANPDPEILPEHAHEVRPDVIMATGRSDYPNQVNNALCFPYIFRGALDVGATTINEEMKLACVHAIAELARREATDLGAAYGGETPRFGPDYLIPRPFDPRLLMSVAPAVARAAMESGVATRPIEDIDSYRDRLSSWVFRTGLMMKPLFDRARADRKRVVYAEGEEETVLRAVQTVVDEGLAFPILVGRPAVIQSRIERLGLRIRAGEHFELTNIDDDPRFTDYWQLYHEIMARHGVNPAAAKAVVRSRSAVIAALMLRRGEADAMLCGTVGRYQKKLAYVLNVLGREPGVSRTSAMSAVINEKGVFFFVDTHVQVDPDAHMIAEAALQASYRLKLFGIEPKVALISHSNFGSHDDAGALKMRQALELILERAPNLEVDGEMHVDAALDPIVRERLLPGSRLKGSANLFVFPNLSAANTAYNLVRSMTDGVGIGPILMGVSKPAHILTPAATVRRVVNMTALAAVEAQMRSELQAAQAQNTAADD